jgi:hypothetical protein
VRRLPDHPACSVCGQPFGDLLCDAIDALIVEETGPWLRSEPLRRTVYQRCDRLLCVICAFTVRAPNGAQADYCPSHSPGPRGR